MGVTAILARMASTIRLASGAAATAGPVIKATGRYRRSHGTWATLQSPLKARGISSLRSPASASRMFTSTGTFKGDLQEVRFEPLEPRLVRHRVGNA